VSWWPLVALDPGSKLGSLRSSFPQLLEYVIGKGGRLTPGQDAAQGTVKRGWWGLADDRDMPAPLEQKVG